MLNTIFYLYIYDCHKSGPNPDFSEKFNFLCNQLSFCFFTGTNQNQSGTTCFPKSSRFKKGESEISTGCVFQLGIRVCMVPAGMGLHAGINVILFTK